ncbi:MAG TPA: tetratricopeptide repeat protein [Limnochordia bacterium]
MPAARSAAAIARQAVALKREQRLQEAEALLREGLARYAGDVRLLASLADTFVRQRRLAEAENLAKEILRGAPGEAAALVVLGDVRLLQRRYAEAAAFFEEARALAPSGYVLRRLADAWRRAGRPERAVALLEERLAQAPDDTAARRALAAALVAAGEREKARVAYHALALADPDDTFAFKEYIRLLTADAEPRQAAAEIERLMRLARHASNPHLRALLAEQYAAQGDLDRAVRELEEALRRAPGDLYLSKQLGFLYYRRARECGFTGEGAEPARRAITLFRQILERDPADRPVLSALAAAYRRTDRAAEGLAVFQALLARHPDARHLWGEIRRFTAAIEQAANGEMTDEPSGGE